MDQIESVQYQTALALTGTWKGTSTNKIYEELGWESFSHRRWFGRLVQFFKILHGFTPENFKIPVIIFLVPEVKTTFPVLNTEQTHA